MTTLQESAMRLALAALTSTDALPYEDWMRASGQPAIKALNAALAQQELPQKERPDFMAGYDAGMADAKRMAQQREQQPVCAGCGIPAGDVHMSTCKSGKWPSRVSNGDTAAPAPQPAQGEWITDEGRLKWAMWRIAELESAPQPAQGVGRTNPGDETGGAVERFGWQTFLGKSPEIVPATNGSFVWYSDYLKLWQSAQPKQEPLRELTEPQVHGIAHRKATRYTYIAKPSEVMYGFSETHIVDFVRAIEKAMGR